MSTTGFFTRKETESTTRPAGKNLSCTSCGLYREATSPKMQPYGNFAKGIMNIGVMPNDSDDQRGLPFQGRTGRFLKQTYAEFGIDLFEDCININAINCHSEDKNSPTNHELDCCRKIVLAAIEKYKPKLIIAFGMPAVYSLIGNRWKKDIGTITKWRGWTIPDQDLKTWICPVFSPQYAEYTDEKKTTDRLIWKQDLKQAFSMLSKKPTVYVEPEIEIIEDLSVINDHTKYKSELMVSPYAAFDYETTGLKPHADGHRIVCVSIANTANHVWAFMLPRTRSGKQPFIDFLQNQKISKIAQNMKFEETWSAVRLKQPVKGWQWDTMLASHQLDNRQGVSGLKFQTYVQFGVIDYDSEISPWLQSDGTSANGLNKVLELIEIPGGKEKLLRYCGFDSIYEYRLAHMQMELILPKQPRI